MPLKLKNLILRLKSWPPAKKKKIKIIFLIFSALMTGFLYLLYYLYLFHNLQSKGELIYPLNPEEHGGLQSQLTFFAIRVREMIDGYWHISDPGFYENRNLAVHLYSSLPSAIYYFIYLFVGFKYLFIIGDFLLIAGIFILIFSLVYLLTRRYYISLFFTFMFLMIRDLLLIVLPGLRPISNINQLKELVKVFSPFVLSDWETPRRLNFLVSFSTRPGFLFFIPALIFLFLFIKEKKKLYAILLGIFYGLLFYAYPFYWMYMTIVFGLLGLAYIFKKNFTQLKQLVFSGAIAWLVSTFYWIGQFKLKALPHFKDIADHGFLVELGREFKWSFWFWYLFCALIAIFIYYYGKTKNRTYLAYFFIPLLLAGFIGFNMQVITGVNFSPMTWWTRVGLVPIFLASTVLFVWFFEGLEKKNKIIKKIVIAFMVILAIFQITGAVQGQMVAAIKREGGHLLPKGVGESLIWIDKNLPKDSVILALNPNTNDSLLIYTPARTFIQYPYNSIVSEKEREERIYMVYKFFKVTPEIFEKKFKEPSFLGLYGQILKGTNFDEGGNDPRISVALDIIAGYKNYKFDLAQALAKYKIDYIYYEPADKELTDADFDRFNYLKKVYSNDGGVKIYKLIPGKIN